MPPWSHTSSAFRDRTNGGPKLWGLPAFIDNGSKGTQVENRQRNTSRWIVVFFLLLRGKMNRSSWMVGLLVLCMILAATAVEGMLL